MSTGARTSIRVTTEEHPGRVVRAWYELATGIQASPFVHPGWFRAWWKAFGRGRPVLLVARRGRELTGVLALERRRGLRSPTNWHTPEFGVLAEDQPTREALVDALFRHGASALTLDFIDAGGADHDTIRQRGAEHHLLERTLQRSPYLVLDGTWDEFFASLKSSHRRQLRRLRRRLEESGEVAFEVHDGHTNLDGLLRDGFRLESSGWKDRQGTAILSDAAITTFYRDVARWAADQGWLRLAFLTHDDRSIAFALGVDANGVTYGLKTGYDPAFRSLGPGRLLQADLIRHTFDVGQRRFEMVGTDDAYKLSWTNNVHVRLRIHGFAPGLAGFVRRRVIVDGRPLAKRGLEAVQHGTQRLRGARGGHEGA